MFNPFQAKEEKASIWLGASNIIYRVESKAEWFYLHLTFPLKKKKEKSSPPTLTPSPAFIKLLHVSVYAVRTKMNAFSATSMQLNL